MVSLLQELGHHNQESRTVKPLGREGTAAGIGVAVGMLLMAILCRAIRWRDSHRFGSGARAPPNVVLRTDRPRSGGVSV